MKKTIFLLFIVLSGMLFPLFADTGIGAAFSYGFDRGANNMGGVLTLSTPAIPGSVQTLRLAFDGSDYINFGITDDWWVVQEDVTGDLDFYIGLGFYSGFSMNDGDPDFQLGGRFPLGLTIMPLDFLEFFLEVAPAVGLGFEPTIYFPAWNAQGALGFRLWF